ncbi:hypothetical protein D3OALGA1CA_2736 [Olavius algarvensis associated proteobacterium Delta 3]|nr:hypothetical protein D3OALGA1CA_2736 [Olavius algarvensis associated proteobacterium Delta 3]CAB5166489.1 hypothetical protein D3OALGB2SA_5788 [Olavius algarvensis associated proteobacterium Delta 3]
MESESKPLATLRHNPDPDSDYSIDLILLNAPIFHPII